MKTTAAILVETGKPLEFVQLDIPPLKPGQALVEIAFSGVQESPRYPAGMALRFARVKRYRPDKSPLEADTLQTVKSHFEQSRM